MGVSGLSAREVARLRTLGLAAASKATGLFEGANDFRLGFPAERGAEADPSLGIEADLGGHPLAPVVSDLAIASFGLPAGKKVTHRLRGFTHVRGASAQGYGARTLGALGREYGIELAVSHEELGFEPQGVGSIALAASRSAPAPSLRVADWTDRGEFRAVHVVLGGVRPRPGQFDRFEAAIREVLWESRRVEPALTRTVTAGVDLGAFVQVDVEFERGGATFMEVVSRSSAPLPLARRAVRRVLTFWDSGATCDPVTGLLALACALAARAGFALTLVPSDQLSEACALFREIGARLEVAEAPGLVVLKTPGREN
jgi:RNA 3'-terminal phosphate cyclase